MPAGTHCEFQISLFHLCSGQALNSMRLAKAKAPRVSGARLPEGRAGEFAMAFRVAAAPKEQPPPESLRQKDRARLTVWKVSATTMADHRRGKPVSRPVKALRSRDRRGRRRRTGAIPCGCRNRSAMMSREVHNGPTDETQARGEPYRGDPEGGDGLAQPASGQAPARRLAPARRAGGWCRSPAMTCPSSTKASWPSICGPARMRACSTSATWARSWFTAADVDAALETLLPGELKLLGDMQAALFAAARRGRRDHRRSDGHPARRGILRRRQRRDQAWRHRGLRAAACRETLSSII